MNLSEIKSAVRANMRSSSLHGKNIEFEAKTAAAGKVLATAMSSLASMSDIKIKHIKKGVSYKDFDMVFYSSSDASSFYGKVQQLSKDIQPSVSVFSGQTSTVSHNGNDTTRKKWYELVGGFGNWVTGLVTTGAGLMNNKFDSSEAAALAQAEAERAAAEAEAAKSRNTMIAIGAGAFVLILVLILALRKK